MKIKRANLLPNVITAFGLCCGLFVIFKINMTEIGKVNWDILILTTGILLLGAFADLLDGLVARVMKVESEFGGFFDSMADAITFGVAPAVIVLKSLSLEPHTEMSFLLIAGAMVYSACGVLRLVRFSVMGQQATEDAQLMEAHKKNFTGLPIPAAAAALVSSNLFLFSNEFSIQTILSNETRAWILFVQMLVLGYFMVSRWKFPSYKALHIRVTSFWRVFLIVLFTAFVIFYGLMQHFSLVLLTLSWVYFIVALILSIARLIAGKRSKALEDFEPEPEPDLQEDDPKL